MEKKLYEFDDVVCDMTGRKKRYYNFIRDNNNIAEIDVVYRTIRLNVPMDSREEDIHKTLNIFSKILIQNVDFIDKFHLYALTGDFNNKSRYGRNHIVTEFMGSGDNIVLVKNGGFNHNDKTRGKFVLVKYKNKNVIVPIDKARELYKSDIFFRPLTSIQEKLYLDFVNPEDIIDSAFPYTTLNKEHNVSLYVSSAIFQTSFFLAEHDDLKNTSIITDVDGDMNVNFYIKDADILNKGIVLPKIKFDENDGKIKKGVNVSVKDNHNKVIEIDKSHIDFSNFSGENIALHDNPMLVDNVSFHILR